MTSAYSVMGHDSPSMEVVMLGNPRWLVCGDTGFAHIFFYGEGVDSPSLCGIGDRRNYRLGEVVVRCALCEKRLANVPPSASNAILFTPFTSAGRRIPKLPSLDILDGSPRRF